MNHEIDDAVGSMTLADAMLGDQIVEIHNLAAHGNYPGTVRRVRAGDTTRKAARALSAVVHDEAALFPPGVADWLGRIEDAIERRDRVVHAVARGQCVECGREQDFLHPRSGEVVDRSRETVQVITGELRGLRSEGVAIAEQVSQNVNARLVRDARRRAAETGEPQGPPQVYPERSARVCADCASDGQGSVTVQLGPAVSVMPPGWDPTALLGEAKNAQAEASE